MTVESTFLIRYRVDLGWSTPTKSHHASLACVFCSQSLAVLLVVQGVVDFVTSLIVVANGVNFSRGI